ncbi:aromatic ring-hydroxylating dioxygenase subunit alpha [Pseudonocardia charpentierae]|uniref:Aromatic ring-hydroxylating dioxygenase subunit alpha n=1 Tax=Pseudonocardia charpentierae TaxID=3075545 RepID=A0ABU2NIK0_9PSEU|nr:aromatic ring-hydroxylating dioxygenase subunit alpha [Pseudonocardia sp. DSM 45834]MDT0353793.1 aromatic ring-hydroxylating dioxygenase subunit alpha [Pseudonocardia sp. DSM 45834]
MNTPGNGFAHDDDVNYPLNCWYVAATSGEVGRTMLTREILGRPVLLYRQESGEVVALTDICPHRGTQLSTGQLDGDRVVCGYHGFEFGPDGRCVRVPSQAHVPFGASVRAFPVVEEAPVVWIWMGDPAKATRREPPRLPWLHEDGWDVFAGQLEVEANYLALHDNSLDFTHLPYVHKELSPKGYVSLPPPLDIAVSEFSVSYSRSFPPGPLPKWQVTATGLDPAGDYEIRESGQFVSPALHVVHMDILVPGPVSEGDQQAYLRPWIRGFTPVNPYRTHVFYWVARNYRRGSAEVTAHLRAVHERILHEDKHVIESMQSHAGHYGARSDLTLVNADVAAVKAHEIVSTMLVRERAGSLNVRRPFPARTGRF